MSYHDFPAEPIGGAAIATTGSGRSQARRLLTTASVGLRGRIESRVPFRSVAALRKRQEKNLRRISRHAFGTVPFYRELARSRGLTARDLRSTQDLKRLPLIDGTDLQANPHRFVSSAYPDDALVKLHSTGTSAYGAKTVHWHPNDLMSVVAFGERDRSVLRRLLGKSVGQVRLSFYHPATSTPVTSRFHASRLLVPRRAVRTEWAQYDASLEETAQALDRVQPHVVFSYGSIAQSFLLHVLDRGWKVHLPSVWVFGGDAMSEMARTHIEEELGCLLYSTYQAVEAGRFGFECEERNGYHMNVDVCDVRIVDDHGDDVTAGQVGEVVISNLVNRGTVLLNYKLGDRAMWSGERCTCGRSLPLLKLQGSRTSDTLRLRNGGELHDHVLVHACQDKMHDVLQFQIVEKAPESIVWRLVVSQSADRKEITSSLPRLSRSVMSPGAEIEVSFVDRLLVPSGRKLTRVVRQDARSNIA